MEYFDIDLPEDPVLAFLTLEKDFRQKFDKRLDAADGNSPVVDFYEDYIFQVVGAARALEISGFDEFDRRITGSNYYEVRRSVTLLVEQLKVQAAVVNSRRINYYSIPLNTETKTEIMNYITKMRELIKKLEMNEDKKIYILKKLNEMERELERNRTRLEVIGDFSISVANYIEKVGEKAEPLRKWLDSITKIFSVARDKTDNGGKIPPPEATKRIEPPKAVGEADIPF